MNDHILYSEEEKIVHNDESYMNSFMDEKKMMGANQAKIQALYVIKTTIKNQQYHRGKKRIWYD